MLQYVWQIAAEALGPDSSEASAWVNAQKAALARSQLRLFCRRILRLYPNPAEAPPEVKQAVAYLWKNRRRMNYAAYRKAGFPISSGTVESAAKTLIQQRMKQAGMRWSRNGAQAMLALASSANDGMKSLSDHLRPNIGMHPRRRFPRCRLRCRPSFQSMVQGPCPWTWWCDKTLLACESQYSPAASGR